MLPKLKGWTLYAEQHVWGSWFALGLAVYPLQQLSSTGDVDAQETKPVAHPCHCCWHLFLISSVCVLFTGFFIPGFPKLQRFQAHHEQILSKLFPKLKKHMVPLCYWLLNANVALCVTAINIISSLIYIHNLLGVPHHRTASAVGEAGI